MTNYELLRQKTEELISSAQGTIDKKISHLPLYDILRVDINSAFMRDSQGLRTHLGTLMAGNYPLGDNFEADNIKYDKDTTYHILVDRFTRHLELVKSWARGQNNLLTLLSLA
jgi:hypothetical protein